MTAALLLLLAPDYWVYVTAESADEVYLVRFDGREASVAKRIEVGYQETEIEGPHGLAVSPDGKHWFLAMAHGKPNGFVYRYDTGTDEPTGRVELGLFPATMQISRATGLLYCVNFDLHGDMKPSTVSIVDPEAMVEVARTKTGPMPHGSRLSPDGRLHYSCSMMAGKLYEIDAFSFEVKRTLALDGEHAGHGEHHHGTSKPTWVFPHPKEPRVYVTMSGKNAVAEVDTAAWKIARTFKTGKGPYNVEVSPDGSRMVVTCKSGASVEIWDLPAGRKLAGIPSTRKVTHGVVISPDGRFAFVSNEGVGGEKGTLDVLDLSKNARVATVDLGLQAGGIVFWKMDQR